VVADVAATRGRKGTPVTIDGVEYPSRTAAAKILVGTGITMSETARLVGMTPQTVYACTKGADKAKERLVTRYRLVKLASTGKYTSSELGQRLGLSTPKIVALLKKRGLKAAPAVKTKTPKIETPAVNA
jgi:DNA-binding CsgD family transcriptional regulator